MAISEQGIGELPSEEETAARGLERRDFKEVFVTLQGVVKTRKRRLERRLRGA